MSGVAMVGSVIISTTCYILRHAITIYNLRRWVVIIAVATTRWVYTRLLVVVVLVMRIVTGTIILTVVSAIVLPIVTPVVLSVVSPIVLPIVLTVANIGVLRAS